MGLSPYTRGNLYGVKEYAMGLSPYTRGNLKSGIDVQRSQVYPRTHGEKPNTGCQGLSPYTRGNPRAMEDSPLRLLVMGSIPVHTGKPTRFWAKGLSPYTRGNPHLGAFNLRGSIPVHTGKPCKVYPRTHGETIKVKTSGRKGSIPVHTGKPLRGNIAMGRQ